MLQYYDKDTRTLTLPWNFNSPLVDLPEDTKIVIFDENYIIDKCSKFNQPINKGSLPNSITHLTFGWEFNQPVDNLPSNITHLTFGGHFNQSVENLPESLIYLSFCPYYSINNIPFGVLIVNINFDSNDKYNANVENLPSSIKKIIVNNIKKIGFIKKIPFGCEIVEKKY